MGILKRGLASEKRWLTRSTQLEALVQHEGLVQLNSCSKYFPDWKIKSDQNNNTESSENPYFINPTGLAS